MKEVKVTFEGREVTVKVSPMFIGRMERYCILGDDLSFNEWRGFLGLTGTWKSEADAEVALEKAAERMSRA